MQRLIFVLMLFFVVPLSGKEILRFSCVGDANSIDTPVSVNLDGFNYNADEGALVLFEVTGSGEVPIPSQLETGHSAKLWFVLKGSGSGNTRRSFVLRLQLKQEGEVSSSHLGIRRGAQYLQLAAGDQPLLNYYFETVFPPENADPLYRKSGFIHPLWSPGGEVLTRIQPPDHYHHFGIWGPWTKTFIGHREVDFWNLAKGQGTVEFGGFIAEMEGPVYTGFQLLQRHIDFGAKGSDQTAMNELLDVRAWQVDENVRVIDYSTTLYTPLETGILLDAYRYGGGIGFRATEKWHNENCSVLTSEGKTRIDADGSMARWCIVEGESSTREGRSGILFLSHPSNRMHPEPMRVWPLNANGGRGDMFFEFCPIRHEEWRLSPGRNYTLKYRLVVFDGEMEAERAEQYWKGFANSPRMIVTN
jgi:hypothetical protein